MLADTTGSVPRLGDGQAADQRVGPRTNAPRKKTGIGTVAGGSDHGAGTAAGPDPETGSEPGESSTSLLYGLYVRLRKVDLNFFCDLTL